MLIINQSMMGIGEAGVAENPNFATTLYTGNGSTQSIITGKNNAAGSLAWLKSRSLGGSQHTLMDTVRGTSKALLSNSTAAEQTGVSGLYVTAFNSNGVTLGSSGAVNSNLVTYVLWTFLEAAGFFDVVSYTGNGVARTIAHNLGVDVGCVIVKDLSTASQWAVYHRMLDTGIFPERYYIDLSGTNGQVREATMWNDALPTTSVFSLGSSATVNQPSNNYIAYVFAHNPSQGIACGGFTTDGSGNATVNCGFQPRFVMSKCRTASSDWVVIDTERGAGNRLEPNNSDAETTGITYTFTGTGFTVSGEQNTQDYIYIVIG